MNGCRKITPALRTLCLTVLSATILMTESSNPAPLVAPMTERRDSVSIAPALDQIAVTETSIRAPVRHLQGIAARTFLEQNRERSNRSRSRDDDSDSDSDDDDAAAPRPDIPLSTDSDGMLDGMPPVIPTPGYTPRIIRESGLSGVKLPSLVERPSSMLPGPSASRIDHKMNERLDEAFGLSGAAPQRGAYERRPGNRFGAHPAIYREQSPTDADWRSGSSGNRLASGQRGSSMYNNNNAYVSPIQRTNYNGPSYEDSSRLDGRYAGSSYSQIPEYQDRKQLYPAPSDYQARASGYSAGSLSYQVPEYGASRGNSYPPYAKRAPSYQAREYQDSWERAPWGAPY